MRISQLHGKYVPMLFLTKLRSAQEIYIPKVSSPSENKKVVWKRLLAVGSICPWSGML